MTQLYWLDQALQGGDYLIAAQRLDAILRQAPLSEDRDRLVAAIAETPEGRDALAGRLKLSPAWAIPLVNDIWDLPVDQVLLRSDIIKRTGKGVWSCADSEKFSQRLIDLGQLDEAKSVWQLNCDASASLIYDGGFEHLDTISTTRAFDWQLSNRSEAELSISHDASGQRRLALEVTGTTSLPILKQFVVLKPGRYTLSWHTPNTPQAQAQMLQISYTCKPDLSRAVGGRMSAGQPSVWTLDLVVGDECPGREITFWLPPHAPVQIADVKLIQAGRMDR